MEIKLSLDNETYKSKPDTEETKRLSISIGKSPICMTSESDDIHKFAESVGKYGRTWSPATFINGQRSTNTFEQLQFIALDCDGTISWETFKERADRYNLPVLFAYDTFSSISHNRFRAVFLNDCAVTDKQAAKLMIKALRVIFPECDSACEDIAHFYYGGKELIYFDDNIPEINIEMLFRNMCFYLKNKYGNTHYKRKVYEFAENTGLALNKNKMLDISVIEIDAEENFGKISPETILLHKDNGEILPKIYYALKFGDNNTKSTSAQKTPKNHYPFRSSDIPAVREQCRLFREFENGSKWLYHHELYGIAVALTQIETGSKLFLNSLLANSQYDSYTSKYNHWDYFLNYFKEYEYKPQNCNSFCPYKNECQHGVNILSKIKSRTIVKLSNFKEKYYPIDEVEKDVRNKIEAAVNAYGTDIHVIKAQTSVGKTETYLSLMENSDKPFLIAVPTNILKHDVYRRAVDKGIEVMETPSLQELQKNGNVPRDISNHIDKLYENGKYKSVIPYIKKVIKERGVICLQDYLDELDKIKNFHGHIITTHRKLLNYDEETLSRYEIIIDEDIIYKAVMTNQETITVEKLKKISRNFNLKSTVSYKIQQMLECAKTEQFFTVPEIEFDIEAAEQKKDDTSWGFDISSLCQAEKFCFRKKSIQENVLEDCITFLKPIEFYNVKYTIVSATANETIYKYFFGSDKVQFYECKKARYLGTLDQYYDRSMSRADIRANIDTFKKIKERFGNVYTITFDEFKKLIDELELHLCFDDLHFGNTEGCNFLAGQKLNVVGTPHYPPYLYKLFAYTIGITFDLTAEIKPNQLVSHNGCQFKLTTFNDEVLRNIQLWIIETELEQAIGRARLLRKETGYVNLFSNFPLLQANLKRFEW